MEARWEQTGFWFYSCKIGKIDLIKTASKDESMERVKEWGNGNRKTGDFINLQDKDQEKETGCYCCPNSVLGDKK